ncbi:VanZ family protein [Blastococcus capsensis]|uniref:VanZ family protein n=1 Tax=Blastococcus capsensis TaxID=1564163 RepID=UPI0025400DFD|nr:VanZ family protein [Blastococcus capsensis]MDK3257818.1 VanZ family protein [Blastococcus capsensis]
MGAAGGVPARVAFGLVVLVSLVVLFAPASGVPSGPPGTDKVVHVLLFAALAVSGRWAGVRAAPLAAALLSYAAASELLQGLTPLARSMSFLDLVADAIGVVVGLLAWRRATRRPR